MATQSATASASGVARPAFEDGLGRRYRPAPRGDQAPPEILCFRPELTDVPAFEFSLRERVARLAEFRPPSYSRIRKVDRLSDERGTVVLMSDCVAGARVSELLAAAEQGRAILDLDAALAIIRQLIPAMTLLHRQGGVAHGALAPERLIVTPQARLIVVEHVTGAALEQLRYSRERYWKELRVALPMSVGLPRFDESADLTQLGVVALSLILGRPLRDDEYPAQVGDLVSAAFARTSDGGREGLPSGLRDWLRRALEVDVRHSFKSLSEAQNALDQLVAIGAKDNADGALQTFLDSYHHPAPPKPPVAKPYVISAAPFPAPPMPAPPPPPPLPPLPMKAHVEVVEHRKSGPSRWSRLAADRRVWVAAGVIAMMAAAGGLYAAQQGYSTAAASVGTGTMIVATNPPGGAVDVDGVGRGHTPLTLILPAGAHVMELHGAGDPRTIPITIASGSEVSQFFELPSAASEASLQTPLAPVVVAADLSAADQAAKLEPGWVSVAAPFDMELYEQGKLVGSSGIDRIMLPAGRHDIEVVSEALGYREPRTVNILPNRVATINVTLPKGTISLNALPWATVSIDGENAGETPIGNLSLTIGPHEVVFTNPQLGEQRRVIMVTQRAPVRLSVDLTKK
jgi:hypothetical protein